MDTRTIDRKGILAYLLITFGITYAIELALILPGFRADGVPPFLGQLVIAGVMWAPAFAALLTLKLVMHEPLRGLNLRFGRLRPYLVAALDAAFSFQTIRPRRYHNRALAAGGVFGGGDRLGPQQPWPAYALAGSPSPERRREGAAVRDVPPAADTRGRCLAGLGPGRYSCNRVQ
jgi:hypothetical protein